MTVSAASWGVRVASTTSFLGVALFLITWPVQGITPQPGLDFSYVAGLHMAAHEGLHYGTQVVGTYGPLGFLRYPFLYYPWTARLAMLYTGGVHLLLCLSLVHLLRRMMPTLAAFLIAWVAVGIITLEPESALVVVIVWLVEAMRTGGPRQLRRAFPVLAGVVVGLEVLIKVNTGATVAALAVVVVLATEWRDWRRLQIFAASFLVTFAVLWFAAGQAVSNLPSYISTAQQVVDGWSSAMQALGPVSQLWGALAVAITVFVVAWRSTTTEPMRIRVAILLVWLGLGFSVFKEGFVGQSPGHEVVFFGTALGTVIAFSGRGQRRATVLWGLALVSSIAVAVTTYSPGNFLHPVVDARMLRDQVRVMASSSRTAQLIASARRTMTGAYGLDQTMVSQLRGHTVSVVPSEQSMLWAYQQHWTPTPVYEWYYALTPALDELDARTLASAEGPQRLLDTVSAPVNGRNNLFDAPAAQRAMLCHYTPLSTSATYAVLARIPDRCGPPKLLETIRARWQQYVAVPPPPHRDDMVVVRIDGVAPTGLEALRTTVWRSYERSIALKDGAAAPRSYALVPDTTVDGLVMSVPTAADFPAPFSLNAGATQLSVSISNGSAAPGPIYRFYAQPIATLPHSRTS